MREFATLAFARAGINLRWEGSGVDEKGIDESTGRVLIEVDPRFYRPAEVDELLGNPRKAKEELGWNPTKTSFEQLVEKMVDSDMELARKEASR